MESGGSERTGRRRTGDGRRFIDAVLEVDEDEDAILLHGGVFLTKRAGLLFFRARIDF